MPSSAANTLILDCGTMVGHVQHELELPQVVVPYFGFDPTTIGAPFLPMRLSNGLLASFRAIYRDDNKMWRIEFSVAVPEIAAGIFPVGSRRSNYAAIFTKVLGAVGIIYNVEFVPVGSPEYEECLAQAETSGERDRTQAGPGGRNYGWF